VPGWRARGCVGLNRVWLARVRVIITRPERDAQRWRQALSQQGIDAVALPLIQIRPVSDPQPLRDAWTAVHDFTALMFVSAAAAEHFFACQPDRAAIADGAGPRLWATGPGTVAALQRLGVHPGRIDAPDADSGQFDSEALWRLVGGTVQAGQRVLIVRGSDHDPAAQGPSGASASERDPALPPGQGRDWLARQLVLAGAQVAFVVAYWRAAPVFNAAERVLAQAALNDGTIWLFTSAEAISNLLACLPGRDWSGARALVTHPRIAQAARSARFGVVWASRPALADVVASIKSAG